MGLLETLNSIFGQSPEYTNELAQINAQTMPVIQKGATPISTPAPGTVQASPTVASESAAPMMGGTANIGITPQNYMSMLGNYETPTVSVPNVQMPQAPQISATPKDPLQQLLQMARSGQQKAQSRQMPPSLQALGNVDLRGMTPQDQQAYVSGVNKLVSGFNNQQPSSAGMSLKDRLNFALNVYKAQQTKPEKEKSVEYEDYIDVNTGQVKRVDKAQGTVDPNLTPKSIYDNVMAKSAKDAVKKEQDRMAILHGNIPGNTKDLYSEAERETIMKAWNRKYPDESISYTPGKEPWYWFNTDPEFIEGSIPTSDVETSTQSYTEANPLKPTSQADIDSAKSGDVLLIDGKYYTKP